MVGAGFAFDAPAVGYQCSRILLPSNVVMVRSSGSSATGWTAGASSTARSQVRSGVDVPPRVVPPSVDVVELAVVEVVVPAESPPDSEHADASRATAPTAAHHMARRR